MLNSKLAEEIIYFYYTATELTLNLYNHHSLFRLEAHQVVHLQNTHKTLSSSFCVMAVSALDVLQWIAIKFGFVQFSIIQYCV